MAGNIPIVGFHDLMCVLISGHRAKIKLSAQDDVLLPYMTSLLSLIASDFNKMVSYEDRLTGVDALIATGSDNSSRYFEYYFRNIPSIIRKNRTSVGVISGSEEPAALHELGRDVFNYFGLGCRNVSKLFVPENFDIDCLASSFVGFQNIINHNKYGNNYDYQKAIRLISGKKFLDGGFFLMEESKEVVSAISVLYYERYQNTNHLADLLKAHEEKTQCVVSANGWVNGSISFGTAQEPAIDDYADGVDTMKFLEGPY